VSGKTKEDARKKKRQAMADADRGLVFDAGTLTVGEYLERWLSDCLEPLVNSGKMAHSTFVRYEGIVNNDISPTLGRKKLRNLSRAEVRALYSTKGNELSSRSVDYIHVTLQKALGQAMRDDLISRNVPFFIVYQCVSGRLQYWLQYACADLGRHHAMIATLVSDQEFYRLR